MFTASRRVDYAVDGDGIHRAVDYTFGSSAVHVPIKEVLALAGWRGTLPAESKLGIVIAVFALVGPAVLVLVLRLMGAW